MEKDKLRILLQVLEDQSFSATAQKLGYTPSGISRAITALEDTFGFPLLIRKANGVKPTAACLALLPEIHEILYHEDLLFQKAQEINGLSIGSIAIGTAYSRFCGPLQKRIQSFQQTYPGITFHITSGFSNDLCDQLLAHTLDFILIGKRLGQWQWHPIKESPMMAWVPAHFDLANQHTIPIQSFAQEPYIEIYAGTDTDNKRILKQNHVQPNIQMHATDSYTAFAMVEAGFGMVLNEEENCVFQSPNVKILPVTPTQTIEIGIAYLDDLTPAAKRFLPVLKEMVDVL